MSLCGCYPSCSCELNVEPPELLTLTGNGDPSSGGWTLTALETVFSAAAADNAIAITPGGAYGHSPQIGLNIEDGDTVDLSIGAGGLTAEVIIDPSSTAPVTSGPAGLKIDCCAEGGVDVGVDDTYSIDMDLTSAVITANLIADPDGALDITATGVSVLPNSSSGIEVTSSGVAVKLEDDPVAVAPAADNLARFTTSGDLTVSEAHVLSQLNSDIVDIARQNSGINVATITSGSKVILVGSAGASSSNSLSITNTNSGSEDLVLVIEGHAEIVAKSNGLLQQRVLQYTAFLETTSTSGGATMIGAAGLFTASELANSTGTISTALSARHRGILRLVILMPSGSSATWRSRVTCLEQLVGYTNATTADSWYQFNNIRSYVFPVKEGAAWSIV